MNTRILMASGLMSLAAMFARADLYVDAAADPSSADGTAEHPYATIQAAVDAASAGTTIRIAEGVYATGGREIEGYTHARVYIDGKALHLIGAGRGKTVIAGEQSATADGRGTGARRCIHANWADGTIIEGVTLKGGSTVSSPDHQTHYNSQSGGGIMCEGGTSGGTTSDPLAVYVVDSEIIDCRAAFGGGAKGGTFIRCLFDSCGADQGAASDNSRLVNCVATRSCPLHTWNTDGVVYDSTIVNCTLVDNATKTAVANTSHVVNSLVTTSSSVSETSSGTTDITGSVLSSSASKGRVQLLAPAVGDWRLLNTSDAVDAANYSALELLSFPEGVDPFKDFSGNAIVGNAGQIITCRTTGDEQNDRRGNISGNQETERTFQGFSVDDLMPSEFPPDQSCGGITGQHHGQCRGRDPRGKQHIDQQGRRQNRSSSGNDPLSRFHLIAQHLPE